jgi:hypothetical protein
VDTIGALAGTTKEFTLQERLPNGTSADVSVSVAYGAQGQTGTPLPVDVTVRDLDGKSISVHQVLVTEAPAPGSVITPNPSDNAGLPPPSGSFRGY